MSSAEKQVRKQRRKREKQAFQKAIRMELREHKSSFLVFSVLRALVIVSLVRQLMLGSYESAFYCALALALLYAPSWVQVQLHIELPPALEITVLCFIFAAEILGEVHAFYVRIPGWDTMLHTLNGFLAAAVGFSLVKLLNDSKRITFDLSPFYLSLVAFCFSMTIGVLWEFFEFGMDFFFGSDMQKDTVIHALHSVTLVVLEEVLRDAGVRIQTNDRVACRRSQRDVDAAGQPALGVVQHLHLKRRGLGKIQHDRARRVGGRAVHQQRLDLLMRNRLREQILKQRAQAARGVVCHDDKADFHHHHAPSLSGWGKDYAGV